MTQNPEDLSPELVELFATKAPHARDEDPRSLLEWARELREAALTDELSGLVNRRGLYAALEAEQNAVSAGQRASALLVVDIDHHREIARSYGPAGADEVVAAFGDVARGFLRAMDVSGRWDPARFLVVLPHCPLDGAESVAIRLGREFARLLVAGTRDGVEEHIALSLSVGATRFFPGQEASAAVARAKAGVDRAHALGVGQVVTTPR